jgi:hypothetical protein
VRLRAADIYSDPHRFPPLIVFPRVIDSLP